METPGGSLNRVWHMSRGIVFASDTRVVYPRLPTARYHSALAQASHGETQSTFLGGVSPHAAVDESEGRAVSGIGGDGPQSAADGFGSLGQAPIAAVGENVITSKLAAGEGEVEAVEAIPKPEDLEPPFTPLEYKMPEELFRAAKTAAEGTAESFWSYNLYRGPGGEAGDPRAKVKVHYCTSKHTAERVMQEYFMNEKVLGFDLEWAIDANKSQGPRRNVSLIQLASPSRIALFHLALFPKSCDDMVAPSFRKVMEDPDVKKVGVWIKGDCTRLRTYLGIDSRGVFELSHLYKLIKYSMTGEHQLVNKKLVKLAKQVEDYLRLPLFKGVDVRTSDWSQPLKMDQIICMLSLPSVPLSPRL